MISFVAVKLSSAAREQLLLCRNQLRARAKYGHFREPEAYRLELVQLGDCQQHQLRMAERVLASVDIEPFVVNIEGGGYLDTCIPVPIYCALRNDDGYRRLLQLQQMLTEIFALKGFAPDPHTYWPHITLGYEILWEETGRYHRDDNKLFPRIEERVTGLCLMGTDWVKGRERLVTMAEQQL